MLSSERVEQHTHSEAEMRLMNLRGLVQTSGADPSSVLDSLWLVVHYRDWENITDPKGWPMTFQGYVKAAQWDIDDLYRFVHNNRHTREKNGPFHDPRVAERMKELRLTVTRLLPPLGKVGAPEENDNAAKGEEENNVLNTNIDCGRVHDDSRYAIRRLRRDASEGNPDDDDRARKAEILEAFEAGQLSPHGAAIRAGYRKRHLQAPDDPEALAAYLLRKWDRDRISVLLATLADALTD